MFSVDLKKISVQYQVSRCFTGFLQQVTNWKTYRAEKSFLVIYLGNIHVLRNQDLGLFDPPPLPPF